MSTSDIIKHKKDLRHLVWTQTRHSSGTVGSFLKSYDVKAGKKRYYKLSDFDAFSGIVGHECINELIADRLLSLLNIPHLHYQLISAWIRIEEKEYSTWLCRSEDFKKFGERKIALDTYYQLERNLDESPMDFCVRNGWECYVYQMLLIDYLILNRDRHGANIEILQNPRNRTVRPAPLFDHGLSFVFSCHDRESVSRFDVMEAKPVQSFVGSRSARKNLELIPVGFLNDLPRLKESDRDIILNGMDEILASEFSDAIWEMIWRRWNVIESICCT